MAAPPTDVSPSALWLKLQQRPKPSDVVDLPVRNAEGEPVGKVRIQVLELDRHTEAKVRGQSKLEQLKKLHNVTGSEGQSDGLREALGDLIAKEVLAMACVEVEPISDGSDGRPPVYRRIFSSGDDVSRVLTPDEVSALFSQYMLVQDKYGPREDLIGSPEELDAWIKRLAEGGESFPLASLPWPRLAELTSLLAARAYSLSAILESLQQNSPDTLASLLGSLDSGTTWSGEPLVGVDEIGSNPSAASEPKPRVMGDREFTMADAVAMAKKIHGE